MNRTSAAAVLSAVTMMLGAGGAAAVSEQQQIFFAPQMNRLWTTVFTNEVPLRWTWVTNAASARLDIVGMNSTITSTFNGVTSNYLWTAFTGTSPAEEDTYDLTLTFPGTAADAWTAELIRNRDGTLIIVMRGDGEGKC
jgi:hypothetical protein